MKVKVEIKSDKYWVYRAMLATQRLKPTKSGTIKDKIWFEMLRAKHSPIEEYVLWIDAIVPERVHTHIVRHEEIGKYVATSRTDIKHPEPLPDGMRSLSLSINAKRIIEISEQRLCESAWDETTEFLELIVENIPDPILKNLCASKCVRCNFCIEPKTNCGFINTAKFEKQRDFFENGI